MKGTTNAQRNAIVDSASAVDSLTLTKADGTTQKHTVSNIIPKDDAPTSGSSKFVTSGAIYTALQGRVPVESGKGLSTNDYTTAEKSKVSNLPDNANNTFATKTELTNAVSSVYKYKGTKAAYSALPTSGNTTGDVWNVTAANGNIPAGTNYAWNGSAWDALGGEIDLSGYVPTSRTVNGKALTGNITLAASDVSAVPTTRKVNNKALSADITLSAADVGALASGGTAAKATADASGNNIVNTYATKTELTNGLAGKQNALTFDSAPTSGSNNPVTSGGVYSAINTVNSAVSAKQDKLTFDTTPTSGSSNPVTSGGVYTAINGANSGFSCIIIPSPKLYGSYIMPVICSATSGSSLSTTYDLDHTAQSWKKPLSDPTGKCIIPYVETKNEATLRTSTMRKYSIRSSTYSNYAGFIVKGSGTVKLYLSNMHIETTQTWVYSTNSTTRPYIQYDFVDGELTGATIRYAACASSERVCTISVEDICEIEVS